MIVSYAKPISDLVKQAAKIAANKNIDLSHCGKMCSTCAFNYNQDKTLPYLIAADTAADKLFTNGEFNCHTHDFKDAGKPCAGFLIVKTIFGEKFNPE